jgi:murein DD-endopeptidase MepM/ murein hydrolase activator NlpD
MRRNYRYGRRKKSRAGLWIFLILLLAAGGVAGYLYLSPKFERVPPMVEMKKSHYWSPGKVIHATLRDNHALKGYQAILSDGKKRVVVASESFATPLKETEVAITLPAKAGLDPKAGRWRLDLVVRDRSFWNLGEGNSAQASATILVDTEPPKVSILSRSPSIVRGGSGMVIFRATDPNLKEVYVQVGKKRFEVLPYRQKGVWATLIAWPFRTEKFQPTIVAVDRAGNRKTLPIPFEKNYKEYKTSWIGLSDRFLDGKIAEIALEDENASRVKERLKRFKAVNEGMRTANERLIHDKTERPSPVDFGRWRLKAFYPLKNAKRVASFGDERHYYYKDRNREVSGSYHMGYDLASVRHAPIRSSNPATVVYTGYNGIYGNMPILDHGFGLYTLYGHCSQVLVSDGEHVSAGQVIAKTGKTGLALGDHLHFGILVQGVEVLPMDWMKQNWIESHIHRVMQRADRKIARSGTQEPEKKK